MLDHAQLDDAIVDADLVVLLASIVHLTADDTLLDRYDVAAFDHGRGPATLSPADADEIRALAVDVLGRVDPVEAITGPPISDDLMHRIMMFCAGEAIDADYVDLVRDEANFHHEDRRRFAWDREPGPTSSTGSTSRSSARASAGSAPPSGSSKRGSRTPCSRRTTASAARGSRTPTPTSGSTCPTTSTRSRSRPIPNGPTTTRVAASSPTTSSAAPPTTGSHRTSGSTPR